MIYNVAQAIYDCHPYTDVGVDMSGKEYPAEISFTELSEVDDGLYNTVIRQAKAAIVAMNMGDASARKDEGRADIATHHSSAEIAPDNTSPTNDTLIDERALVIASDGLQDCKITDPIAMCRSIIISYETARKPSQPSEITVVKEAEESAEGEYFSRKPYAEQSEIIQSYFTYYYRYIGLPAGYVYGLLAEIVNTKLLLDDVLRQNDALLKRESSEYAWVIIDDNPDNKELRYWEGWNFTEYHKDAIRFSRKEDARKVARTVLKEVPTRIEQHGWINNEIEGQNT